VYVSREGRGWGVCMGHWMHRTHRYLMKAPPTPLPLHARTNTHHLLPYAQRHTRHVGYASERANSTW